VNQSWGQVNLIIEPADRGKETAAVLDWNDADLFKTLVGRRIAQSTDLTASSFEELWAMFATPHVRGEDSFQYILSRTLMRPREVLRFVRECINSAINHRNDKITEEDIFRAEKNNSAEALVDISLEMRDVKPEYDNVPYAFIGCSAVMSRVAVEDRLARSMPA